MTLLSARIPRIVAYLFCAFTLLMSASCITSEGFSTAPRDDFEALWRIFDRHYCFFDYKKKEYGLDWNEVHQRYAAQVSDSMSPQALFQVLGKMCNELRDGHVNLWSPQNTARYTRWYEAYPVNFSDSLLRRALGKAEEYQLASTMWDMCAAPHLTTKSVLEISTKSCATSPPAMV